MNKLSSETLRSVAEARLLDALPEAEPQSAAAILHELRVHQIELEMQNEALRQAQLALEESRDRYVDLYDFAPIGYLTLTRSGAISEINLTGAELLGAERQRLLRNSFALLVAEEDRACWYRFFMAQFESDERRSCELLLSHRDGTRFHAQLDCLRIKAGDGFTLRVALSDISERKQAEEKQRIAAIAFDSQEGMLVTDANAVILQVNQAFTRLTGYSAAEVLGKTPAILNSGRQSKDFYQCLWLTLKQKHFWQGEMWNKRRDGKIYAEWLTISGVVAPDGRLTHYVGTFYDITQNREAEAEIHRLAYYDVLTRLPNRRLLYDRLAQAIAASGRHGQHGAILFLDMDNFKMLNDTLGHDVGDQMLVEVAQRLHDAVREGDTIARLGGDEFVLLLENLSTDAHEASLQAAQVGDKVLQIISSPFLLRESEFICTTSVGISLFCGHDESVDELLKHSDMAMYQAKKEGRNGVRFFDPEMQAALVEHSVLESLLRHALEREQFRLFYQIQVDSAGRAIGAEALLRWMHPERGLIPPIKFIPLAEETGLIVPIGLWVLRTACAQIKAWSDNSATRDLQLAINVSARQFRQLDFVEQVRLALVDSGIDPTRLEIELTESLVLDNVADTIVKMKALKELGVRFSMDDFGTGYSSLSYLKLLPLDQLKIDQSFVRDLSVDPSDSAIVQAIITMGRAFDLHVIAEGVEDEVQRDLLSRHGCDAFQGYLFGRPVPGSEFDQLISKFF